MTSKINLIFMGGFTYPHGMAGTRRIQNIISGLKEYPDIVTRVMLQRQSVNDSILSGVHEGTSYETVMGNLFKLQMLLSLPILHYRTITVLKRVFLSDHKNIIYFYGPLFLESVLPLSYAQRLGYKIVFDVIEDYSLTTEISRSFYLYLRAILSSRISSRIKDLAAGIIVISSYLEEKFRMLTQNKVPIHYLPISVDMDRFFDKTDRLKSTVSLFYAGSFSKKDGLPVLFDAFDRLADRYENIHLIITGLGDKEDMKIFLARMDMSPHKDRIEFKGYLDDKEYYATLKEADIPCMTRVGIPFANAGFPFKLGEFLATGKPVIASRVSDVDRFLVHGQNAMLVHPGSSTEIFEAVKFILDNPESAATIGARGREVAKSVFDHRQQAKVLLTFLKNI
jgi:glycosyltransferase involved in cell wall biosynthesis